MATTAPTKPQPSNTAGSRPNPAPASESNDLLTRKDFGVHVTGRVDSLDDVRNRSGTAKNGNAYSFWQQSASIAIGGEMIEVSRRSDTEPAEPLFKFELDEIVRLKVGNGRVYQGQLSFDAL